MEAKFKRILACVTVLFFLSSAETANVGTDHRSGLLAAISDTTPKERPSQATQPGGAEEISAILDYPTQVALPKYAATIRRNALLYGMDWRIILAVMNQESGFRKGAVSRRGAYGLMQVMPKTGNEVASRLGFNNLRHPNRNISGGTYYLASLYDLFEGADGGDRLRLALASYNAGPARIYDAQELAAYLGDDPHSWTAVEKALPLLSKRYYSLHKSIWDGGKPRSGYFGEWRQTVLYVQKVIRDYERYSMVLE